MAKIGSKTKQRNTNRVRLGLLLALFATAALAPGFGAQGHQDESQGELHLDMAVMQGDGGSVSGHAGGDFSGHTGTGAGGHQKHVPGAGAGSNGDADGFAPNGENGLILLADYVPQGGVPGSGEGPTGGQPGGDSVQTAENNSGGEGFGSGGGGAGGGSGGGGDGGGSGGGVTGSGPGGVDGNGGDGTGPKPGPGDAPPHGYTPPHGDVRDPCVANSCDGGPPLTFGPKTEDGPGDIVPGGGSDLHVGAVPEPATWLMLIVGFMGVGGALRVQRRKAAPPRPYRQRRVVEHRNLDA